ncbi:unnamed protein product [Onchocerca flexuosa]|uniref:Uncharacterized protein n=1 Tax=Onchocerca flexuosa TaxID=387005 RepID=A0A183HJP9_9BILA|nr:unnamed protein product [Onchocerca flexuosa]
MAHEIRLRYFFINDRKMAINKDKVKQQWNSVNGTITNITTTTITTTAASTTSSSLEFFE